LEAALQLFLLPIPVTVEDGDGKGPLNLADRGHLPEVPAKRAVVPVDGKLWQVTVARSLLLLDQRLALGAKGAVIRARFERRPQGLVDLRERDAVEFQPLRQFNG